MRIGIKILFATAVAAGACAVPAAPAAGTNAAATATAASPVIARGAGLEITRGELDDALTGYQLQLQKLPAAQITQLQAQMLNRLINQQLLLRHATDADRSAGKQAADLQITAQRENAGSPGAFGQRLKNLGLTESDFTARVTREATAQAVLQRELSVTVTDDEAKDYYATHAFEFEQPEMARVSHILIFTVDPVTHAALPGAQLEIRRKLSENLVTAARAGADFGRLARLYSEDPGSKANGGELLPFPRGQMSPEIDAAAFSLTNNQVSEVITTGIGYQVLKLLEKIPPRKTDYLTAIAKIKQGLTQQKTEQLGLAYLAGLRKAAAVEILDPNLKAAAGDNSAPAPAPATTPKP